MDNRTLYVTRNDFKRLEELLAVVGSSNYRDRADLKALEGELRRARIVEPRDVPVSVVTMNTKLRLRDTQSGQEMIFTLVFPDQADVDAGRISVMSPVGTAVLGYAAGDTIEWTVPAGKRRFEIAEVLYQPEAAGDYEL